MLPHRSTPGDKMPQTAVKRVRLEIAPYQRAFQRGPCEGEHGREKESSTRWERASGSR